MDKLNMFQSRFGKIDGFGWWDLKRISADSGKKIYLNRVQEEFQTCGDSLDVIRSRTSGNEQTGQSDMVKVKYNCTLTYGTPKIFRSVY